MSGAGEARFAITVDQDLDHWPEPIYANWVTLSRTPHDLTLYFSQVRLPLILADAMPEDVQVVATPMVRAIIPVNTLPALAKALEEQLEEVRSILAEQQGRQVS